MKVTGNGAAAVSREAERITQNGINGVNRGTTKPIVSAKSGIIPSSSASEINRAAQERAAHSQAKADFVSIPLDALNSAGAWLDKGLTNLAGRIDASWAGEGVGDAAEWITEKEKLANEKACAAYKHCINGLQELLPNSDVERILGGSGLILVGGFKMTGGAILTLAGVATSHLGIGFGGITAGTITGLSGVSDIEQGINEIKLGLRNDRTTRTGNYVRDTLYDGNDTIYHLSTGMAMMAGMALKPYVIPRKNPVLAGGEQKDIAKKAAMGADDAAVGDSVYIPKDADGNPIPLNKQIINGQDIPLPDPAAEGRPHTVIGGKISSETGEVYRQTATFRGGSWPTANGYEVPISEVHWTNHGRAAAHTNPHQHVFIYDFENKYWYRSEPEIF